MAPGIKLTDPGRRPEASLSKNFDVVEAAERLSLLPPTRGAGKNVDLVPG
jgi:hypothetical protein